MKYDERGRMIDASMFVADGSPMESLGNPYRTSNVYKNGDKPIETTYYVHLPRNAPRTRDGSNPVKVIDRFDDRGAKTERLIYRELTGTLADNNLVYVVQRRDARDRDIELYFVDSTDKLVMGPGEFARRTQVYDRRGLVTENHYFGLNGPIVAKSIGAASVVSSRDTSGRVVETSFLGPDGRPMPNSNGYVSCRYEYDSAGRVLSESYFDSSARPMNDKTGFHRFTQRFEGPARAEAVYFDTEKREVAGPFGWSKLIRTAGPSGSPPTWKAYDAKGSPVAAEVVINQVVPGGQGVKIGAQPGDVIVSYNGVDIIDQFQLIELVDSGPGSGRSLVLDRSGKRIERTVPRGKLGIALQVRPKNGRMAKN